MRLRQLTGQAFLDAIKETPNDGLILSRYILHTTSLVATSMEALADILVHRSSDLEKPPFAKTLMKKYIGNSLITTEDEEHRHLRKMTTPAFHFRNIKNLYPVSWAKSTEFCRTLNKTLGERPDRVLDIWHYSTQVTMDVIGLAGLGHDMDSSQHRDDRLINVYKEIFEPTKDKLLFFICQISLSPCVVDKLSRGLNKNDFVAEKKAKLKLESAGSQGSLDVVPCMIRSNEFPDENLVDHLMKLAAANSHSHETTSSTLTWSFCFLSRHPDIQSHLRSEILECIQDPKVLLNSAFDVAGLSKAYTTSTASTRVAIRDTEVAGHHILVGTMIYLVPWAINHHSTMWGPDAKEFLPERRIDKETGCPTMRGGAGNNYSFPTFSHGPRCCIGERSARAGLWALVAALVGSFAMELVDPLEKKSSQAERLRVS
ncbi:hypothetical protein COCMIDRAFT_34304 [Bipolaris oryzae ATCC 44560]|uniref:Cytochrome P450 n=1 Tax=Bipolaris oryzae ATCC 44560 TaxID=930090 RepID=W6ZL63_COCMI|nr:uncharacterized protein COCMIDRAFT_34304 [Bipolaris oryzae ATCC 44560]EUC48254.1 hypothetical protein COCMIDRAFT_34304 [Bipolaris oryzae ATCC 44560]